LRFNRLLKILLLLILHSSSFAAAYVYDTDFNLGDTLGQTGNLIGSSDTFTFNNDADASLSGGIVANTAHTSDKTIIISSGISVTGDHVDGAIQVNAPTAMTATGGDTVDNDVDIAGTIYNVHSFLADGSFNVSSLGSLNGEGIDYLIVAGGGAGGAGTSHSGAGGGGGGVLENSTSVSAAIHNIVIGDGGQPTSGYSLGDNGDDSTFLGFVATGGGAGAYGRASTNINGVSGGSGGGGSRYGGGGTRDLEPR